MASSDRRTNPQDRRKQGELFGGSIEPDKVPLAERMRPRTLDEILGQDEAIGPDSAFGRILRSKSVAIPSVILWGPPGTGKTTIARVIAADTGYRFVRISGVLDGVKEIRDAVESAQDALSMERKPTLALVDEIHRFNRAQQDAFLPHIESGLLTVVGQTTENVSFRIRGALLSRLRVIALNPLTRDVLSQIVERALKDNERGLGSWNLEIDDDAKLLLADLSMSDARRAITGLEWAAVTAKSQSAGRITKEIVQSSFGSQPAPFDQEGDYHYDTISAFIKSMRGSDPDAALYYMVRALESGEDPLFITRRMIIFASEEVLELFKPDQEVENDPEKFYDELITIDLDTLEPYMVGPYTPDLARPISALAAEVREKGYPDNIKAALLGSCTNSSYEDIGRAAHIADQALSRGVKAAIPFMISPGSEAVYETVRRDGLLQKLEALGGLVLANACGPCIGQWKRVDVQQNELNTIVTSFNRNFRGRNDANMETMDFMSSPEIVTAFALSGSLSFNPLKDALPSPGGSFVLSAPSADDLPSAGFSENRPGLVLPSSNGHDIAIAISPNSERLALLTPFDRWNGQDFKELPLLLKAVGKCTTDAISPAGKWLRYRGHLDRISDNMFSGAVNAFSKETGKGLNVLTGERDTFPKIARHYKSQGLGWAVVGDDNYGEGSSREHAAMSPRYLGAKAVIVKSFARIHETNLKKQGVLALMFVNPADYEKVQEKDRISIIGLKEFAPGKNLTAVLHHEDGSTEQISLKHSFTEEQIGWFKRGAALNPDR